MCGLAEVLHNMGAKVSGSDQHENAQTQRLSQLGVRVTIGHKAELVHDSDVVVYSSAVKASNPEFAEARKMRIPAIPRAEVLAEIMRLKRGVAVGGTHGKTTTTSMAASIFLKGNLNPTIVVGGRLDLIKSTALLGTGEWIVAEADESDGSFSKLSPEVAIITNIDNDHLDHYGSFEQLQKAFLDFAGRIPFYGLLVACGDDKVIRETFKNFGKRVLYYGFGTDNDFVLKGENSIYEVWNEGKKLGTFNLHLPGKHNALNALASLIVGLEAGLSFETCTAGLMQFQGVDRRFQLKGEVKGVPVYDDYGHHPTEVLAVLQAFREKFPKGHLHVIFQPHRYSRTRDCWAQFLTCFAQADSLYLYDIYAAGESPIDNLSSERLAGEIKKPKTQYVKDRTKFIAELGSKLNSKNQDVVITLGAGDVWKDGMKLLG